MEPWIFVPMSWCAGDGCGALDVIDQMPADHPQHLIISMTSDGFDAGFVIGHGMRDEIRSLDDLAEATGSHAIRLWDGNENPVVDFGQYAMNLEDGWVFESFEYYPAGAFREAAAAWLVL